jgi:hypothetical protein
MVSVQSRQSASAESERQFTSIHRGIPTGPVKLTARHNGRNIVVDLMV